MPANVSSTWALRREINIAPLVDVAMVLLIIFMAAAPILQTGYDVALPRSADGPAVEPIRILLDGKGGLLLNDRPVERTDLEKEIAALLAGRRDGFVLFDAADDAGYDSVIAVIDAIRRSGARIGIAMPDKP